MLFKRNLWFLMIGWAILIICKLYAQDQPTYMYSQPDSAKTMDVVIDTGHVIAYGEYIPPPYHIYVTNDTVMVNQAQVYPLSKQTYEVQKKSKKKPLDPEQLQVKSEIEEAFWNYRKDHDEQEATELIIAEYENHPIITSLKNPISRRILRVDFSDSNFSYISMDKEVVGYDMSGPPWVPSKEFNDMTINILFQAIQSTLQGGGSWVTSYGAWGAINNITTEGIIQVIDKIKSGEITKEEGKAQIHEMEISLPREHEVFHYIESL